MNRLRLVPCLLAIPCLWATLLDTASAQKDSNWLGKRVMLKSPFSKLRPENPQVVIKVRGAILKVDKIQGANFLVRCIGAEGWTTRNEVVPVDDAVTYYSGLLRTNPRNNYALTMRGIAKYDRKDYDGALKDYNDALKLNKNDVSALSNRGSLWLSRKEYDKALTDFNRSLELDPKDAITLSNRG